MPKGSVFGPVLFYRNDLLNIVYSFALLFAESNFPKKCCSAQDPLLFKKRFVTEFKATISKPLFYTFFHSVYRKYSALTSAPNEFEISDIQPSDLIVTPAQVGTLLENVSPSTIAVADGIPTFVLRNCSVTLAPLVHLVFSSILSLRKWTRIWKCCFITPIHKKESKNNRENYRPLTKLPRLSLILEKFFFYYVYSKFHYKLNSRQHGFRKEHSTITQLLVFLDEIDTNYDENVEEVIIYLDFANAFDNVDHAIFFKQLSLYVHYNDFLQLIFIPKRKKPACNINDVLYDEVTITSGVPQGNDYGPLLFLVCIDDMLLLPEN